MSEVESNSTIFRRKKKPKKVNTVDFDELFARGHAKAQQIHMEPPMGQNGMNIRREPPMPPLQTVQPQMMQQQKIQQQMTQPQLPVPTTTAANSTSFEVYSKDEAFIKSQKGSGIGYAEKVQSYLTDQQTTLAGFEGPQQVQKKTYSQQYSQPTIQMSEAERKEELLKRAQDMPEDPNITQTAHQRHFSVTQASLNPAHQNEKRLMTLTFIKKTRCRAKR